MNCNIFLIEQQVLTKILIEIELIHVQSAFIFRFYQIGVS